MERIFAAINGVRIATINYSVRICQIEFSLQKWQISQLNKLLAAFEILITAKLVLCQRKKARKLIEFVLIQLNPSSTRHRRNENPIYTYMIAHKALV